MIRWRKFMLSQTTGYAIQALGFLATQSDFVLIREIAEATQIPQGYLAKILHQLARKGILETQRGKKGGVRLAPAKQKLTFFDIALLMDDPVVTMRCMMGTAQCSPTRHCPCHDFWSKQREREHALLRHKTLKDMARFYKRSAKR
jgi:Rrf2 family protein